MNDKLALNIRNLASAARSRNSDRMANEVKNNPILKNGRTAINQDTESYISRLSKTFPNEKQREIFIRSANSAALSGPRNFQLLPKHYAEKHSINVVYLDMTKNILNEASDEKPTPYETSIQNLTQTAKEAHHRGKWLGVAKVGILLGIASAAAWRLTMVLFNAIERVFLEWAKTKRSPKLVKRISGSTFATMIVVAAVEAIVASLALRIVKKLSEIKSQVTNKKKSEVPGEVKMMTTGKLQRNVNRIQNISKNLS